MADSLAIYLRDHLAGSHFALNLLDSLHSQYPGEDLGAFALELHSEITADQNVLRAIASRVGSSVQFELTDIAGWVAEKASLLKFQRDGSHGGIGTFEALETLSLGIRGKWALWQALPVIRDFDARIPEEDFAGLAARADSQFARVEQMRLKVARTAFASSAPKG